MREARSDPAKVVCRTFGLQPFWTVTLDLITFPPDMPQYLQGGILEFLRAIDFIGCEDCERAEEESKTMDYIKLMDLFNGEGDSTFVAWLESASAWTAGIWIVELLNSRSTIFHRSLRTYKRLWLRNVFGIYRERIRRRIIRWLVADLALFKDSTSTLNRDTVSSPSPHKPRARTHPLIT